MDGQAPSFLLVRMDYSDYAAIYDAEYAGYDDDVAFYLSWAQKAHPPVLELGCGTGRILLPLADHGVEMWGLDNCSAMLERARAKLSSRPLETRRRVTLVEQDMTSFRLNRKFGLIYLPFREFMHLTRVDQQLACLHAIRRHLCRDGRLLINVYDVDLVTLVHSRQAADPVLYRQPGGDYLDEQGRQVLLCSASRYDPEQQCLFEERFYETIGPGGQILERRFVRLSQRWFFRWEMVHLLSRSGFKVEQLLGGYFGERYSGLGQEMIFVARLRPRRSWSSVGSMVRS